MKKSREPPNIMAVVTDVIFPGNGEPYIVTVCDYYPGMGSIIARRKCFPQWMDGRVPRKGNSVAHLDPRYGSRGWHSINTRFTEPGDLQD